MRELLRWAEEDAPEPKGNQHVENNDDPGGDKSQWLVDAWSVGGVLARLDHDLWRDEFEGEPDAQWQEDQIVEIAQDRDEIGDQVNGAEGIGDDQDCKGFGNPRRARVEHGEVERGYVALEVAGGFAPMDEPGMGAGHRAIVASNYFSRCVVWPRKGLLDKGFYAE